MSSAGVTPNNAIFCCPITLISFDLKYQVTTNNSIICCPVGSSQYNKMLQPFLLLSLALFVLQCVDAINPKAIFACLGLVTIQDHLQEHQVHNEIEDLILNSFLSKIRLKQLCCNGARNISLSFNVVPLHLLNANPNTSLSGRK